MDDKKIRCAAYLRVSTDEQVVTGSSLGGQEERILNEISKNDNYIIDKKRHIFIDDGYSGAKDDRPAFNKMLSAAKRGEFDILFVYAIDRLYRKTLGLLETVDTLDTCGVKFKSITQEIDTSSSFGKVILQIMGSIAELERNLIRERTIMGKLSKAKEGYFVGGGMPPLGYNFETIGKGKKAVINDGEAKIIKKIFNLFVNEGKSLGEIKKVLELSGEKTKDDIKYEGTAKKVKNKNGSWHPTSVSRILQNEMYIGNYYYGKTEVVNGKKVYTSKEKWISFPCPAIIEDKEIYYKAQELLVKNQTTKNNETNNIFAGLIKCDLCGKNYVSAPTKKDGKSYIYYKCKGSIRINHLEDCRCLNNSISEMFLFDACWGKIYEGLKEPKKMLKDYYENSKKDDKLNEYYNALEEINKKIEKGNKSVQKLYENLYTDDDENSVKNKEIAIKNIQTDVVGFQKTKNDLSEIISKLEDVEKNKSNFLDLVKKYEGKVDNITEEKKIDLIKLFVDRITVFKGGKLRIVLKIEAEDNDDNNGNNGNKTETLKKNVINFNAITSATI